MFPLPPPIGPEQLTSRVNDRSTSPSRSAKPSEALPRSALAFLRANVFHYRLLNKAERRKLRRDAWTFIATKSWEGCRGLVVTEEMQATIAAQACLMLLGRDHDCFGRVPTILVYPAGFQMIDERWQTEGWPAFAAAGQAVRRGPVILAWDAALAEGRDPSLGNNLVIHEFAHQLDGFTDGAFEFPGEYARQGIRILTAEHRRLERDLDRGRDTFLGDYAATNLSEFFATASERFFTQPAKLRHFHPRVYELLAATYALDPIEWFVRAKTRP